MAKDKNKLTPETSAEWLASCGFIFPTTEEELRRFNSIMGEVDPQITGNEVDPFKIIRESAPVVKPLKAGKVLPLTPYQMVAKKASEDALSNKTSGGKKDEGHSKGAHEKE